MDHRGVPIDCHGIPFDRKYKRENFDPAKPFPNSVVSNGRDGKRARDEEAFVSLDEARGCALLDSGASCGVTSVVAADEIQKSRIAYGEESGSSVQPCKIRGLQFADGGRAKPSFNLQQPITAGLLKGQQMDFQLLDRDNCHIPPLVSVNQMRENQMVVDFEEGKVQFKRTAPGKWYKLPQTAGGLLMIPITAEAAERFGDLETACPTNHG